MLIYQYGLSCINFIPKNIHNGINNKDNTEKNTEPFDPLSVIIFVFTGVRRGGRAESRLLCLGELFGYDRRTSYSIYNIIGGYSIGNYMSGNSVSRCCVKIVSLKKMHEVHL